MGVCLLDTWRWLGGHVDDALAEFRSGGASVSLDYIRMWTGTGPTLVKDWYAKIQIRARPFPVVAGPIQVRLPTAETLQ